MPTGSCSTHIPPNPLKFQTTQYIYILATGLKCENKLLESIQAIRKRPTCRIEDTIVWERWYLWRSEINIDYRLIQCVSGFCSSPLPIFKLSLQVPWIDSKRWLFFFISEPIYARLVFTPTNGDNLFTVEGLHSMCQLDDTHIRTHIQFLRNCYTNGNTGWIFLFVCFFCLSVCLFTCLFACSMMLSFCITMLFVCLLLCCFVT